MLLKTICDLAFSFNHLLKLADDLYIRIGGQEDLGCFLDEVKSTKKIKHCGLYKACASWNVQSYLYGNTQRYVADVLPIILLMT